MVKLNKEQIARVYNTYDFDDEEEIVDVVLVGRQLLIHYIDNRDGSNGTYAPSTENEEDKEKLDFILNGITLERDI